MFAISPELLIGIISLVVTTLGFGVTVASLLYGFSALKARDKQTHDLMMELAGGLRQSHPSAEGA